METKGLTPVKRIGFWRDGRMLFLFSIKLFLQVLDKLQENITEGPSLFQCHQCALGLGELFTQLHFSTASKHFLFVLQAQKNASNSTGFTDLLPWMRSGFLEVLGVLEGWLKQVESS